MRRLSDAFRQRWDPVLLQWWVAAVVVISVAIAVGIGLRRLSPRERPRLLALIPVAAVAVGWTLALDASPEEAVHFIQYGVLGLLLERAFRVRHPGVGALLAAFAAGALAGTLDEVLQWLVRERYWDLRDVVLNVVAVGLVQVAVLVVRPKLERPRPATLRLVLCLVGVEAALLALCFANTPQRVAWYSGRLPCLARALDPTDTMAEYGHLHRFEGIGEMRSRFSLEELRRIDGERGEEVAAILDAYPGSRYGDFLREYPSGVDPFVHEARVHLFSRDANLRDAQAATDPEALAEHATRAWRENQILEMFFPRTLSASSSVLPEATRRWLEVRVDPERYTVSRAGSHLITRVSELVLVGVLAVVAAVCGGVAWTLSSRERAPGQGRSA